MIGHLTKTLLESALNSELDSRLGYEKHEKGEEHRANTRNGYSTKTVKTDCGDLEIQTPRDWGAWFEPAIIPKGKTRLEGFEGTILARYSRGMTVRQAQDAIKELYHGVEISTEVISQVTESVIGAVKEWQSRPVNSAYPVVFLGCLVVKVREQGRVINKSIWHSE